MTGPGEHQRHGYVPATSAAQTFVATGTGDAKYLRYEDGYQVYDVGSGDVTFLQGTSAELPGRWGGAGDLVASLGAAASFGAFAPASSGVHGVDHRERDQHRRRRDPVCLGPGRLTNGPFTLSEPLRSRSRRRRGRHRSPTTR